VSSPGPARLRGLVKASANQVTLELAILACLAVAYTIIRAGQGNDPALALANAHRIASAEGPLFDQIEVSLNAWFTGLPVLAVPACYFYALMHYAATPGVLLLSRRRGGWFYWRGYWALVIASGIALFIYAKFPVAPPRLVPDLGVVDVMRKFSDFGWWGSAASAPKGIGDATNQFAAMPSLHFGWSLWCGLQLWNFRATPWRVAAVAYPSLQALVVIGTGNHFLLDVAAGGACVLAGYALVGFLARPGLSRPPDEAADRRRPDDDDLSEAEALH